MLMLCGRAVKKLVLNEQLSAPACVNFLFKPSTIPCPSPIVPVFVRNLSIDCGQLKLLKLAQNAIFTHNSHVLLLTLLRIKRINNKQLMFGGLW